MFKDLPMPNWCWVNNRFHLILYKFLKKKCGELKLLSFCPIVKWFRQKFYRLVGKSSCSSSYEDWCIKTLLTSSSSCIRSIFSNILHVINLSLEKIGRGPEHGFSHCNWLSEAKQNSIFHHYFRCTEHCMNFNKQTLFL